MGSAYSLSSALGYNLICTVIFIVAILAAKKSKSAAWVLILAGAGVQLFSLIGNEKRLIVLSAYYSTSSLEELRSQHTLNWVVFIIILFTAVILVSLRKPSQEEPEVSANVEDNTPGAYICKFCGKRYDEQLPVCPNCGGKGGIKPKGGSRGSLQAKQQNAGNEQKLHEEDTPSGTGSQSGGYENKKNSTSVVSEDTTGAQINAREKKGPIQSTVTRFDGTSSGEQNMDLNPEQRRLRVICVAGPERGASATGEAVYIGRNTQLCQLVLQNTPGVSNIHCMLHADETTVEVRDMNSSYGTFLSDGTRLEPDKSYFLQSGITLYLGSDNAGVTIEII